MANQHHLGAVLAIANEVERLVMDATIRARFTDSIARLCKMVEDYARAQPPYIKKHERAKKRAAKFKLARGTPGCVDELCPPTQGWIRTSCEDNRFVKVALVVCGYYRPAESVNPLLWFGLFGSAGIQRKPTENEVLMCDFFLLATIHDHELRKPTDTRLFPDKYDGKWFERDEFRGFLWKEYRFPRQFYSEVSPVNEKKLSVLTRALERVKAQKTEETKQNRKTTIFAIIISFIVVLVFELFVYFLPITWLKNHPDSYGLQGGIILFIVFSILGFCKRQWRKFCWGVALLALLVLILSLLGGPTKSNVN